MRIASDRQLDQEACEFLEAFDDVVKAARIEGSYILTEATHETA